MQIENFSAFRFSERFRDTEIHFLIRLCKVSDLLTIIFQISDYGEGSG